MPKKDAIYLSPTSIQAWFDNQCPARWKFEREWTAVKQNAFAERGILVHSMMEGKAKKVTDNLAVTFSEKMKHISDLIGMEILHTEIPLKVTLFGGRVIIRERIDAIAKLFDGSTVIVDWKTNYSSGWKNIPLTTIYPQEHTFQGAAYLLRPDEPPKGMKEWPTSVMYIVAPIKGAAQAHRYNKNEEDTENLMKAIEYIACGHDLGYFPKSRGKQCIECPFNLMCYDAPDWKKHYRKRTFKTKK